ncbi:hypothetical protein Tco_1517712 [Tanacetum coccineum]
MTKFLVIKTLYPGLLHYLTANSLPSPKFEEVLSFFPGSLSSLKADSDGGVVGLAISLLLYLGDALDPVEDDCFDVIMEYLVKIDQKACILELKRRYFED